MVPFDCVGFGVLNARELRFDIRGVSGNTGKTQQRAFSRDPRKEAAGKEGVCLIHGCMSTAKYVVRPEGTNEIGQGTLRNDFGEEAGGGRIRTPH